MRTEYYQGRLFINKEKTSPYWCVTFEGRDGKMKRRSTKVPVKGGMFEGMQITAKLAEKLAYQRGVQIALAEEKEYNRHDNTTVRNWCEAYIRKNAGHISQRTYTNALTAYRFFYSFLGARADEPLRLITKMDAKDFITHRRNNVRQKTVAKDVAALSQAFKDAVDAEIIVRNPFAGVSIPQDRAGEKLLKEPFTLEEIRYMIDKFPALWSSAVRCSFETWGQRLGDILRLDWSQFDWERRVVHFVTGKTGRRLRQPMRPGFYAWAQEKWQEAGCPASGLLHARLLALGDGASYQFGVLLRSHGIGMTQAAGGGSRRVRNTKSFHSIRATVATELAAAGVSLGIAKELVGHDSSTVHAVYIRPSYSQLEDATKFLPAI